MSSVPTNINYSILDNIGITPYSGKEYIFTLYNYNIDICSDIKTFFINLANEISINSSELQDLAKLLDEDKLVYHFILSEETINHIIINFISKSINYEEDSNSASFFNKALNIKVIKYMMCRVSYS